MRRLAGLAAVAAVGLLCGAVAGCVTTGPPGAATAQETAEDRVLQLDTAWMVASSLADTYAVLDPSKAEDIAKARSVADVAVQEARFHILASAGDPSKAEVALRVGLSALALFREAVKSYRERPPPG